MKGFLYLGVLLSLASGAWAQSAGDAASIQKLDVQADKDGVRVEVTLTSTVSPRVSLARNPERLILELTGTVPGNTPHSIPFSQHGVKTVRVERDNGAASSPTRSIRRT